jgi:hypothetical protein
MSMSEHDDDAMELDLDPYSSPRQKHGLWGNAGWVIALMGLAGALFMVLFIVDDDPVSRGWGIGLCVAFLAVFAYGVWHMIHHRKPHYYE